MHGSPVLVVIAATLCACGPAVAVDDAASGGSTSDVTSVTATTVETTSTSTSTDAGTGTGTTGTDSTTSSTVTTDDSMTTAMVFGPEPDAGNGSRCVVVADACPRGEKCMPWSLDGTAVYSGTRCSPIDPDPGGPGDACSVESSMYTGLDDCDAGSMCWGVDPDTLDGGGCVPFCAPADPDTACVDPDAICHVVDQLFGVCSAACHPIDDTCPAGACVPAGPIGTPFVCASVAGSAVAGEPCEFLNDCVEGTSCVPADNVPACTDAGCCSPVCSLATPTTCLAGQTCTPWYAAGEAPFPDLEDTGVCLLLP